jgi:hypothetical protein
LRLALSCSAILPGLLRFLVTACLVEATHRTFALANDVLAETVRAGQRRIPHLRAAPVAKIKKNGFFVSGFNFFCV